LLAAGGTLVVYVWKDPGPHVAAMVAMVVAMVVAVVVAMVH
jgi:hypothetical protein